MKRTHVVAVAATLTALATAVAPAAAAGSAPTPGPDKSATATADESTQPADSPNKDDGMAAAATALGVSVDELVAALVAAKTSLADATEVTPDIFIAAVATKLHRPVDQVHNALDPMFAKHDEAKAKAEDEKANAPGKDEPSPFSTDEAAATFGNILGVDQARAKTALNQLLALSTRSNGLALEDQRFGEIAASLGVSPDRLMAALGDMKRAMAGA